MPPLGGTSPPHTMLYVEPVPKLWCTSPCHFLKHFYFFKLENIKHGENYFLTLPENPQTVHFKSSKASFLRVITLTLILGGPAYYCLIFIGCSSPG